ncbi:MAG: hypothetical protein ACW98X_00980 [Promethearchaeota archaeon]|jgi:hypothetical protein
MSKRKYWTVGQIDATGVRGPHEKELEDISIAKYPLFIDIDKDVLEKIVIKDLGGKIENIGFSEDWTISVEMFPDVNIHMSFSYFGNEFGDDIVGEFKFYFSGEHVTWVPGEDSATYIDIVLDFVERRLKREKPFEKNYDSKSDLMKKVLLQRNKPFAYLGETDITPLMNFLGADVKIIDNQWRINKEIFPKIYAEVIWDKEDGLDIRFYGDNLITNLDSYHAEFIGIFFINHILRFITVNNLDTNLPDICYIMFSRYYTKNIGKWDHRTR